MGNEAVIASNDRSGYFGASDTSYIMGNWNTKSFTNWWLVKLGISTNGYKSVAMNAGTCYEHAILDVVGSPRRDYQIIIPEYNLRINYDGDGEGRIDEVKTHSIDKPFKVTKGYLMQVRVQMFGKLYEEGKLPTANIWAYGLREEDYKNFFNPIDKERLTQHPLDYDTAFIDSYLKRITYLKGVLEKGLFPDESYTMR